MDAKHEHSVVVEEYRDEHFDEVADIIAKAFAEPPWNESWTREEVRHKLDEVRTHRNALLLVARLPGHGNKIAGFAAGQHISSFFRLEPYLKDKVPGNSYFLRIMAVHPGFRRMHIASALQEVREKTARELGCEAIVAFTHHDNAARIRMFEREGYRFSHHHFGVYGGVESKHSYFVKRLERQ